MKDLEMLRDLIEKRCPPEEKPLAMAGFALLAETITSIKRIADALEDIEKNTRWKGQ